MNAAKRAKQLRKLLAEELLYINGLSNRNSCSRKYSHSAALSGKKYEDYIVKSPLSDIVVPNKSFLENLWRFSGNFKNHIAIECADTKKNYTYQKLWENSARFATSLRKKFGLQSNDVVSVMLPNCVEFPVVMLGTLQAGCILSPINPIYKEFEIIHQVKLTDPKVIVTIKECYNTVVKALDQIHRTVKIVIVDKQNEVVPEGTIKFSEIAEDGPIDTQLLDTIEPRKDDIAFLPFSSGTTGLPKGVEISHYNLMAGLEVMLDKEIKLPKLTTEDFQDVVPCVLPFFHIYGLMVTLIGHLSMGCKLIAIPKFTPNVYLDVLKSYKSTLLYVVPPLAMFLSKHPDVTEEHLKSVRCVFSGAAPISASDVLPLIDKTKGNITFRQGYGTTETTSVGTVALLSENSDYSSTGIPMSSFEMRFIDPTTGDPVPIGEPGELLLRSPTVMKRYYKNEKATAESILEDGFYKTGDLGYYKEGVGLYITERIKELIKVKGFQVAPAELESLLRSHPAVQDAAVIGIPHEISGEVPKAFIITKNGKSTNEEELQQFVAKQVAFFKKIEEVQFIKEIPKTASGKILRRELKKMYA